MGRDKARLDLGDGPLAMRTAGVLVAAGCAPVIAVGDPDHLGDLAQRGVVAVADAHPGQGPLGGVVTGLDHVDAPVAFVTACDLPFADAATVRRILDVLAAAPQVDAAVPRPDGRWQPAHAAYRVVPAREVAGAAFARGERRLGAVLDTLSVLEVRGFDPRTVADVDTPDEVEALTGTRPDAR